jgi:hypothetical protein
VAGAAVGVGTVLALALLLDLATDVIDRPRDLLQEPAPLPRQLGPSSNR